jgi:amidohydrolase
MDDLFPSDLHDRLIRLRRDLHQHPELSFQEERTAKRLKEELAVLGLRSIDRVAGTGLVARVPGRDPDAPVVAIRGDIDALPIQEATELPFASEVDGVMHACGHDVHATWAVGAAHLLAASPADGDVLIVLQPGEETGRGALAMLETGALDEISVIFGAHVDLQYPVGKVVAQPGPIAAAADNFLITLIGNGAHGARPHEARDAVVGAGALISALQTIVARRLSPGTPGVISIGTLHAGSAPNIIPDRVELSGTIRASDRDVRTTLHEAVQSVTRGVAATHELESEVRIETGPGPVVNTEDAAGWAATAVDQVLGSGALTPLGRVNMAGEDFGCFLERMDGCFLRVGARGANAIPVPAHTPHFAVDEGSIFVGAAVLAESARVASQALRTAR